MPTLKIAYNDDSENLVKRLQEEISNKYPYVTLESFHENIFKERKKAFKLKGSYSARISPFAILIDDNNKVIKAFYSEVMECTYFDIMRSLNSLIIYGPIDNRDNQ